MRHVTLLISKANADRMAMEGFIDEIRREAYSGFLHKYQHFEKSGSHILTINCPEGNFAASLCGNEVVFGEVGTRIAEATFTISVIGKSVTIDKFPCYTTYLDVATPPFHIRRRKGA